MAYLQSFCTLPIWSMLRDAAPLQSTVFTINRGRCSYHVFSPWCCSSRCWCSWLKTPNLLRWRSCCRCWSSSSRCGRLRRRNKSTRKSLILALVLSTTTTLFWLFIILSGQGTGNWRLSSFGVVFVDSANCSPRHSSDNCECRQPSFLHTFCSAQPVIGYCEQDIEHR